MPPPVALRSEEPRKPHPKSLVPYAELLRAAGGDVNAALERAGLADAGAAGASAALQGDAAQLLPQGTLSAEPAAPVAEQARPVARRAARAPTPPAVLLL